MPDLHAVSPLSLSAGADLFVLVLTLLSDESQNKLKLDLLDLMSENSATRLPISSNLFRNKFWQTAEVK